MTLDEIWSHFAGHIVEVESLVTDIRQTTKNELMALARNQKLLEETPDIDDDMLISMRKMFFRDLRNGDHVSYGNKSFSPKEMIYHLHLRKNKQYQWLLVEAYEVFEKFLVHVYAYCGFNFHDCWPLKDYGNITLSELRSQSFQWHMEQARKKKDLPFSVLSVLRRRFPPVPLIEKQNYRAIDLSFAIAFIAKLRHQIVHNRGWAESRDVLVNKVATQIGRYNNGEVPAEISEFARDYFGDGDYENMIALVEVPIHPEIPLDTYINRVGELLKLLLGYAYMLKTTIENTEPDEQA